MFLGQVGSLLEPFYSLRLFKIGILKPLEMPSVDINASAAAELQQAEMEFSWELYLAEMNAYPVPAQAFGHVSCFQIHVIAC